MDEHLQAGDLNHDQILDRNDLLIEQNIYIQLNKLTGIEMDRFKVQLSLNWNCLTFDGLGKGLTMDEIVATRKEAYTSDERKAEKKLHKCLDEIIRGAVDHDKDEFVSVNELYAVLVGMNKGNRILAQEELAMICPSIQMRCPAERVLDFYTELHIGDDKKKYKAFKNSYTEVGMPLEDQIK